MPMKTNHRFLMSAALAFVAVLGCSSASLAQSDSQNSGTTAKQHKQAASSHKVWTNDDLASVRSPADAYVEAKQQQAGKSGESVQTVSAKQPVASGHKVYPSAALSNPKTPADADRMIAWEERDISGQQDYLASLKKEIDEAPAGERKDRLLEVFQKRQQILADTQNELKNLQAKKQDLVKPPADNNSASSEQPPQ